MIDLRSDTVTRPTPGMLAAMHAAEVGDDVWGDDPTANRLQAMTADVTRKEAALFFPSGTQSNLAALMAHCERGDEYLVGQMAHTYRWEGGGAAVLGSIQPQPLEQEADGTIPLAKIATAIKPFGPGLGTHFARSKLLALENTWGGRVLPQSYVLEAAALARSKGLNVHLDGARAFNAAVATETTIADILAPFDSASLCISKGLGAPVGAMLVGDQAFIERAHRWRKMLGGGMRQIGSLAAACIYALENHVGRLNEDHENAAALAAGLREVTQLTVLAQATNVVFLNIPEAHAKPLEAFLAKRSMLMQGAYAARLVTHLDVSRNDIDRFVAAVKNYFAGAQ
ncbi:MAG: low-specificity L-threonine aldolase [Burkholderiales bacterium]|nr:low-specificity L-threonine aldolase [Burkholderiales bacterium]